MNWRAVPLKQAPWPRLAFYVVALVALAGLVVFAVLNPPNRFLAIDTIQHLSAARNLLEGNGLSTSILYYQVQYEQGTIPAPQTVWPGGAAMVAAGLGALGLDIATSFVLVSALCVLMAAIALFLALLAVDVRASIAAPCAALWLVSPTTWHFALRGETEAPFVLFVCLALLGAIEAARNEVARHRAWLLTGAFAALALLWRYQGVYVLPAVFAAVVAATWDRSWRERAQALALTLAAPLSLFVVIFGRNYGLTGSLTGVHGAVVDPIPLWTALRYSEWFSERSVAGLLGIEASWLSRVLLVAVTLLALYAICTALAPFFRRRRAAAPDALSSLPPARRVGVVFATGFLATALGHMFFGALTTATWYLAGVRYFSVLLPATIFLAACGLEAMTRHARFAAWLGVAPRVPRLLSAAAWIPIALVLAMAIAGAKQLSPTTGELEAVLRSRDASGRSVDEYLRQNSKQLFPMLASWAHELHLATGQPIVGLQPSSTSTVTWDAERTLRLCDQLKLRSVMVAPSHLAPPRDKYTANQPLLRELAQGKTHPRLRLLMEAPEAKIYEVLPAERPHAVGSVKPSE